MKNKLLFITSANLATNPRLLKELDSLRGRYKIKVVLFKLGNWSDKIDEVLRSERSDVDFQVIDFTKSNLLSWFIWAILEKLAKFIYPFAPKLLIVNSLAHGRRGLMLLLNVKQVNEIDLIICHNLTALYPTYKFHKQYNKPFIFDIEDYEPGMQHIGANRNYPAICEYLMTRCIPFASKLTCASKLIGDATIDLVGKKIDITYIPNSFFQSEFIAPQTDVFSKDVIKFVWFSQTISFHRGLEEFFDTTKNILATGNISKKISITLIGRLDTAFNRDILSNITPNDKLEIRIMDPLPQHLLHQELSKYHIGLALETGKDYNNEIALSNKIMAYAQAGLYIFASTTKGQRDFMITHPNLGTLFQNNLNNYQAILIDNFETIAGHAQERYLYAQRLSFDSYIEIINKIVLACI